MRVGLSYDLLRLSPCSSIWKQIVRLQYSAPHLKNLSKHPIKLNNPPSQKLTQYTYRNKQTKLFLFLILYLLVINYLKYLEIFYNLYFFFQFYIFNFYFFNLYFYISDQLFEILRNFLQFFIQIFLYFYI